MADNLEGSRRLVHVVRELGSRKVAVLAMKTWGEFGNFRAGELVKVILEREGIDVELVAGESLVPLLAIAGEQMKAVADMAAPYSLKAARYDQILANIASHLKYEANAPGKAISRDGLTALMSGLNPDTIICMKGVLAKILCLDGVVGGRHVLNFITNHGLAEIEIHREPRVTHTIVPLPMTKETLIRELRLDGNSISVCSLYEGWRVSKAEPNNSPQPCVAILCNKGGEEYLNILREAIDHPANAMVIMIVVGDEAMLDQCRRLAGRAGTRVRLYSGLPKEDYRAILASLKRYKRALLVSKTGPNTVAEAINAELPMLLHRSWLPMEAWVEDFVHERRAGKVVDLMQVASHLSTWLSETQQERADGAEQRREEV
jgi:hypothetical protein